MDRQLLERPPTLGPSLRPTGRAIGPGCGPPIRETNVRAAALADAPIIMAIEALAFVNHFDRFSGRQIRRLIANPRARVCVAINDREAILGWCVSLIRTHERCRSGRVYSVAVSPEYAGLGIGRAMLCWMVNQLELSGVARVYLEVRTDNAPAIGLYHSEGFHIVCRLPNYYGDSDGLRMRRILSD